jgi:TonB family protein
VVFEILIDTSGRVQEAKLAQSSGRKDCDEAAHDTIVEDWRFSPAMLRGVAIPWRQRVAVAYRLR